MHEPAPSHAQHMKSKSGLGRVLKALRYSMQGLAAAWRDEHAFRQELMLVCPLILVAAVLPAPIQLTDRAMLIGSLLLILIVELVNSSLEAAVDLVTTDHHPMAGKAKDIGSAAVFLCFVNAGTIWSLVLWTRFIG